MCNGILPEMFAKTAPTSSLLPVPSCQQRRRRRCPHSPTLADSRPALLCLLRRPSARYPHEKNKCRLRRRLFFFLYLARGLALRASSPASQAVRSLSAREKRYCSPAPFAKPRLRRSPLLRSSFLLIKWRSLRTVWGRFSCEHEICPQTVRVNCIAS